MEGGKDRRVEREWREAGLILVATPSTLTVVFLLVFFKFINLIFLHYWHWAHQIYDEDCWNNVRICFRQFSLFSLIIFHRCLLVLMPAVTVYSLGWYLERVLLFTMQISLHGHLISFLATVLAEQRSAPPLWDAIISGEQLRDLLHLPCHGTEGGGRGRVLDEGNMWAGIWREEIQGTGTSQSSVRVEVKDCSPAVSLVWHGPIWPGRII